MIHLTNICAQFSEADSMKFVMDTVVKIIQCIYADTMNHYNRIELLKEIKDSEFNGLMSSLPMFFGRVVRVLLCC